MYFYSFEQWLLFFYIYCFLGWVWESGYVSFKERKWVNRGFMHGPLLPIYGSGAIIILFATLPVKNSLPLIFLFGMISATILEYFTGAEMEKLFHVRYWDYSNQPLNLNGHICLGCSLAWGGFSLLLVKVIHSPIESFVLSLPYEPLKVSVFIITVLATIDMTKSFQAAIGLKNLIAELSENNEELKVLQEKVDVIISSINKKKEEVSQKIEENIQKKKEKYYSLEEKFITGVNALEKLHSSSDETFEEEYNKYKKELGLIKEKIEAHKKIRENYNFSKPVRDLLKRNPYAKSRSDRFNIIKEIKNRNNN